MAGNAAKAPAAPTELRESAAASILKPVMEKARPVLDAARSLAHAASPYIVKGYEVGSKYWQLAQPYHPQDLFPALIGFIWCFYGGAFITAITAIEAFRAVAYRSVKKDVKNLWDQFQLGHEAVIKDDPSAAQQNDPDDLVRKATIALKACDPEALNSALTGLYTGIMAVVAALRIKFAQTITFGSQMGTRLETGLSNEWVYKQLRGVVPAEYHKWIPTIVKYGCQAVGVSLAWAVQRMVSPPVGRLTLPEVFAFHTSIAGGAMLADGVLHYAMATGRISAASYAGPTKNYAGGALACLGFYCQFGRGFHNTGIMGLLLFPIFLPLQMFEFILEMFIGRGY